MSEYEEVKLRIKKLCLDRGITANKLEKDLMFGGGYISKIGLNNAAPNPFKMKQIADYFNVPLDYILYGTESPLPESEPQKEYYYDEQTADIAQKIYDSKALSMLFGAAADASVDDILTTYSVLLALKKKERHDE